MKKRKIKTWPKITIKGKIFDQVDYDRELAAQNNGCAKQERRRLDMAKPKKQFCKYGHDTFICGRYNGTCVLCARRSKHSPKPSNAKLTQEIVDQIRKEYQVKPEKLENIAKRYNVGKATISNIISGKTWDPLILGNVGSRISQSLKGRPSPRKGRPYPLKDRCPNGHPYIVYGRNSRGYCKRCAYIQGRSQSWQEKGILNENGDPFTFEDYDKLLIKQLGECAICHRQQKKDDKAFAADHDHLTHKIRGLLDYRCNRQLLGILKPDESMEVAKYLNPTLNWSALKSLNI